MITILCSLATFSCGIDTPYAEADLPELAYAGELQKAIDLVLQENQDNPRLGISAALIAPGYRTWKGVSGNSHPGVPIAADMLFDAGSVEKNFEAALTLKLVEENRLSLDEPISTYLPSYPNVNGKITIRQLLNHSSGVFNVFEHPDFPWVEGGIDYSKYWEIEEVIKTYVLEPYNPPGVAQHYSSTNYLLLTAIIEEATGTSLTNELRLRFLRPMGLEQTFVSMGELPPTQNSVAHPWVDMDLDGTLDDLYGIPLTWKATLTHPVMFSTPKDLVHWLDALYHERTVLRSDTLAEMLAFPENTFRDPEGGIYGLGVVDYSDVLGMQVIGHGGSSLGYSAAALYLPEYGVSMAWMINTGESPRELADQLMFDIWSSLSDVVKENQDV